MASTNKTTNYELSQFVETDKPAWLTDYNGDMRKLDTALKVVSDVADGASGGISSLTDRMTAAEGAITTNANDIDALEARADALEAGAQSTAGRIIGIESEQITQNAGIEAATELGYNLARPYDSASTYAVGAYVLFQNTLYKCITAVATGEAFDPTKWLAIKATDEIAAGGYTLPIASASQLGGVKVGNGLSIDPLTGILSASGDVEIIPLTTDNITVIASGTNAYNTGSNYFNDSTAGTSGTQTQFTNFSVVLQPEISFYAKIGNLRILRIGLETNFNSVNIPGKSLFHTYCNFDIGGSVIEAPAQDAYATLADPNNSLTSPIRINSEAQFTTSKRLSTSQILYNGGSSAVARTYMYERFYFIYYVE